MKSRIFSGIILTFLFLFFLFIDKKIFSFFMLFIALLGFNELFVIKFKNKKIKLWWIKLLSIIVLALITFNETFYFVNYKTIILFPIVMLSIPIIFYNDKDIYNINDFMYVLGIVYFLGFSFQNIIYLGNFDIFKCFYIFIVAFITDTYAYIGGNLIGRHKLTSISPNKTVEGMVIGSIMGIFSGSIYYFNIVGGMSLISVILLSFLLTVLSEAGDLIFSSIKRYFNKKDYSNIIPGHGGILDRFDSVIYVSMGLSLILNFI